ncbi:MAG: hypothetical protein WCW66_03845 [Patescibacteria group bacterium]
MQLAVLFWFYQEAAICENRLKLIKKHNPSIKIFGLYGGRKKDATMYKKKLGKYLDNFYTSAYSDKQKTWKWIHGDLMILDWYTKRGSKLNWDSIVVVQWDMLVLGNIAKQFPGIKKNELFLSGYRTMDVSIEKKWNWTRVENKLSRKIYLNFKNYIEEKYNYNKKLKCCLFILEVFPRDFFSKWQLLPSKELGMLEYSIPTYAKILRQPIYQRNLGVWWFDNKANNGLTPLNARGIEIKKNFIESELKKKNGYRIFHPYNRLWYD